MSRARAGWNAAFYVLGAILLLFMLLPVVALIATMGWSEFWDGISHPAVKPALILSLKTTLISTAVIVFFGTPLAWILARRAGRAVNIVESLIRLPVVLPPAVAGVALLFAFGRHGLIGSTLYDAGLRISFSTTAVVLAAIFVSAPFFLQSAIAAFRAIDESYLVVARSLGASPWRVFFRIAFPLALPGLIAGAALAWARALGEFGATLMFAGNKMGETQTLTLAVFKVFQTDPKAAQAMSLVLVAVAFGLLLFLSRRAQS